MLIECLLIGITLLTAGCGAHRYPDGQAIRVSTGGRVISSVHTIPLEQYVQGVLEQEVPASWPLEALKAQAVATRTYALYRMKNPRHDRYDVASDTSDQVFIKKRNHSPKITEATEATSGEILTYQGQIIQAFFHSCCGGRSERADQLWSIQTPPALSQIHNDPFCYDCPRFHWDYQISRDDLKHTLEEGGYPLEEPWNIQIESRDEAERVEEIKITSHGSETTLSGTAFRKLLGDTKINSTLFDMTETEEGFTFSGKGSGHGVGLCQWGAYGMAKNGKSYQEILNFYYPKSVLEKSHKETSKDDTEESVTVPFELLEENTDTE